MPLDIVVPTTHHHPICPPEDRNVIGDGETKDLNHLGSLCLLQTRGLRVTGVHYQQLPWCHPDLTSQIDQGIPDKVEGTEKKPV